MKIMYIVNKTHVNSQFILMSLHTDNIFPDYVQLYFSQKILTSLYSLLLHTEYSWLIFGEAGRMSYFCRMRVLLLLGQQ